MKLIILGASHPHTKDYIKTAVEMPAVSQISILADFDTQEHCNQLFLNNKINILPRTSHLSQIDSILDAEQAFDLAIVTGRTSDQQVYLKWVLDQNLPCFCEKPLGLNPKEATWALQAFAQKDLPLKLGFRFAHHPFVQKILGEETPQHLDFEFFVPAWHPNWFRPEERWLLDPHLSGGSVASDLACHFFYVLAFHFPGPIKLDQISTEVVQGKVGDTTFRIRAGTHPDRMIRTMHCESPTRKIAAQEVRGMDGRHSINLFENGVPVPNARSYAYSFLQHEDFLNWMHALDQNTANTFDPDLGKIYQRALDAHFAFAAASTDGDQ